MVLKTANNGDNTFYWRVAGVVGPIILALMAAARLLSWYVFRFVRRDIDAHAKTQGMSQRKPGWEMAWQPVLMLIVMIYAIVAIPIASCGGTNCGPSTNFPS